MCCAQTAAREGKKHYSISTGRECCVHPWETFGVEWGQHNVSNEENGQQCHDVKNFFRVD